MVLGIEPPLDIELVKASEVSTSPNSMLLLRAGFTIGVVSLESSASGRDVYGGDERVEGGERTARAATGVGFTLESLEVLFPILVDYAGLTSLSRFNQLSQWNGVSESLSGSTRCLISYLAKMN